MGTSSKHLPTVLVSSFEETKGHPSPQGSPSFVHLLLSGLLSLHPWFVQRLIPQSVHFLCHALSLSGGESARCMPKGNGNKDRHLAVRADEDDRRVCQEMTQRVSELT